MKDFDAERTNGQVKEPAKFSIGGEQFTLRPIVSAEVLAEFGRREVRHYGETLEAYDTFVKACLVPEDAKKWDKVRKEADPPLTVGAVEQVVWWVMDEAAGRPTVASSSSRRGRAAPTAT